MNKINAWFRNLKVKIDLSKFFSWINQNKLQLLNGLVKSNTISNLWEGSLTLIHLKLRTNFLAHVCSIKISWSLSKELINLGSFRSKSGLLSIYFLSISLILQHFIIKEPSNFLQRPNSINSLSAALYSNVTLKCFRFGKF